MSDRMRSQVTRGTVTLSTVGPRTLLQLTGLEGETIDQVELLLPPGYSASPAGGSDVAVLQVLGSRDHLVALGGDTVAGDQIGDLAAGEFGFKRGASQVVFRNTGTVEITAVTTLITGDLHVTGQVIQGYGGSDQVGLGTHNHADPQGGNTGAPNPGT